MWGRTEENPTSHVHDANPAFQMLLGTRRAHRDTLARKSWPAGHPADHRSSAGRRLGLRTCRTIVHQCTRVVTRRGRKSDVACASDDAAAGKFKSSTSCASVGCGADLEARSAARADICSCDGHGACSLTVTREKLLARMKQTNRQARASTTFSVSRACPPLAARCCGAQRPSTRRR